MVLVWLKKSDISPVGAFSRQRLTVLEKNGGIDFVKLLPVHPFLPA